MSLRRPPIAVVFRLLAGLLLFSQSGCMSALTTAAMREALRETVDSIAAAAATDEASSKQDADVSARLATDDPAEGSVPVISEPKPPSLDEAVDRAILRLKDVGELDAPTRATLLSILEKTSPEDWPAAIDAFAASLEAHRPPPRKQAPPATIVQPVAASAIESDAALLFPASTTPDETALPEPTASTVAFELPAEAEAPGAATPQADLRLVFPAEPAMPERALEPAKLAVIEAARPVGPEPYAAGEGDPVVAPRVALEPSDTEEPVSPPTPPSVIEPPRAAPSLVVSNACFVSRVRAWGVIDKFPAAVFRPGQDVIVYFELEAPTARQSSAGHTTSIDTIFRLVAADGRHVGQWDFEPIDETCHAPRRDYFARYFVRIPETASPGPYRLEMMVTDLVAGISSQTHLDLVVRP